MRPRTSYLICGTARSGSTFFSTALCQTGVAGNPDEYFESADFSRWCDRWGVVTFEEYLARSLKEATTPNGVCGVKIHRDGFLEHFIHNVGELPQYKGRGLSAAELAADIFPDLNYIWLTRRNKVRQAVSLWKASQTQQWVWKKQAGSPPPAAYDFKKIDAQMQMMVRSEAEWEEYFTSAGIKPLTVVYEDFVQEYDETLWLVLRYLGVDGQTEGKWPRASWMRKQADDESERWVQRYYEEKQGQLRQQP